MHLRVDDLVSGFHRLPPGLIDPSARASPVIAVLPAPYVPGYARRISCDIQGHAPFRRDPAEALVARGAGLRGDQGAHPFAGAPPRTIRQRTVALPCARYGAHAGAPGDRKSTRLNSSHIGISYAV